MALLEKMSKQAQEEGRRLEEGEENNEQWSMTQGALIIPQWRGVGVLYHLFLSHNHRCTADTHHKRGDNG